MSKLSLYDLDNLYDDEGAVEPCVGCNKKPNIKNVKKTIVKIPKNKKKWELTTTEYQKVTK